MGIGWTTDAASTRGHDPRSWQTISGLHSTQTQDKKPQYSKLLNAPFRQLMNNTSVNPNQGRSRSFPFYYPVCLNRNGPNSFKPVCLNRNAPNSVYPVKGNATEGNIVKPLKTGPNAAIDYPVKHTRAAAIFYNIETLIDPLNLRHPLRPCFASKWREHFPAIGLRSRKHRVHVGTENAAKVFTPLNRLQP
jgi:hypothetical protein